MNGAYLLLLVFVYSISHSPLCAGPIDTVHSWIKKAQQGYNMRLWLSNQGDLAFPFTTNYSHDHIGLLYPVGTFDEHLTGAYPFIGGKIRGRVPGVVTTGEYGRTVGFGSTLGSEFEPEIRDTLRDRIWQTSILRKAGSVYDTTGTGFYKIEPNRRGIDDDGDGKVDEDDLDGVDNDGDWNPVTDDIGADGVPDSLESGCKGDYDPVTNPDPAFDNYDATSVDLCRTNPDGTHPFKSNRDIYTEKNGMPDHGEPHVDEDYGAISDNDLYCSYTDTFHFPFVTDHIPLGIKVIQKSYAWRSPFTDAVLIIEYEFINVGREGRSEVYVGFHIDPAVGPTTAPPLYYNRNFTGYIPELRTAYFHDPVDKGSTPLGVTLLGYTQPSGVERFRYRWDDILSDFSVNRCQCPGGTDSSWYLDISGESVPPSGYIRNNGSPSELGNLEAWFSIGPYNLVQPGDTIRFAVALLSGYGIEQGANSIRENAGRALSLYSRNYHFPARPPSPLLSVEQGFKKITLRWGGTVEGVWPRDTWDDLNKYVETLPDTSWRRRDPPPGHTRGGRIFKGYRVYRSEDPSGNPSTFTLLRQFEVKDSAAETVTPLDSVFIDSNLVQGRVYWYTVTSFGVPDYAVINYHDFDGSVKTDTIAVEFNESDLLDNRQRVELSFSVSKKLGDVLVVPNPYRVDQDYTFENGGWEGRSSKWTENDRSIRFIHLPPKCTIRVYSLSGDVITTLYHEDTTQGDLQWNLISESNRALASGVYIFTVESDFGKQVGKFVLIR